MCYRNSNLHPASAEETQAIIAARDLLLDENGKYVGDDKAIFATIINSDNDTKSPKSFMVEQNTIIGESADNRAEHNPDTNHFIKNINNKLHNLKNADKTFKTALTNHRIRCFNHDINAVIKDYVPNVGDAVARKKCLHQLHAIPRHHNGIHDQCVNKKWCSFLRVRDEHPDWSEQAIAEKATQMSLRATEGKHMGCDMEGLATLTAFFKRELNEATIDKYAQGGCSNLSENFWGGNIKFTEGKRLNMDLADGWEIVNKLNFARTGDGNVAKTHGNISEQLGLSITACELDYQKKSKKKKDTDKNRMKSPQYKHTRLISKLTRDMRMGKLDAKKAHKSGKVPMGVSMNSAVGAASKKKMERHSPTCSSCGVSGHKLNKCKMPQENKRRARDLVDCSAEDFMMAEMLCIPRRKQKKMEETLDINDWI